jgi:hypothetical protein
MKKDVFYDRFPFWIPAFALALSVVIYAIGVFILSRFGLLIVIFYVLYCLGIELLVIYRSCRNCYYYGKWCGLGKGKIAPLFTKKGNPRSFLDKKVSWYDLIPDFLIGIIPLIGGVILLAFDFSFIFLTLIVCYLLIFFGGTGVIRGSFACRYCKQRKLGCPAQDIFTKERSLPNESS